MFSKSKFKEAENFIHSQARPIDQALYNYEFNDGSSQKVLDLLKDYQNMDGGFGHALEPDFRPSKSSVLATTVAMQYINELKLSKPNVMVEHAISYLLKKINRFPETIPIRYFWYPTPLVPDKAIQAPWWNIKELSPPTINKWPNPTVEVIGYLLQYSELIPNSILLELTEDLQRYLKLVPSITESIFYNFMCFKRLLPHAPLKLQKQIFNMLEKSFNSPELLNTANLKEIKIQRLVTEKNSFLYQKYPEIIKNLLQDEIDRLDPDGGSHPNWKWGDSELWKSVEKEWTGKLTYELLVVLKYCDLLS